MPEPRTQHWWLCFSPHWELTPWWGWRGRWWPWRSGSPAWLGCLSVPRGHSHRTEPHLRSRGWWPRARHRVPRPDTWCSTRSILQGETERSGLVYWYKISPKATKSFNNRNIKKKGKQIDAWKCKHEQARLLQHDTASLWWWHLVQYLTTFFPLPLGYYSCAGTCVFHVPPVGDESSTHAVRASRSSLRVYRRRTTLLPVRHVEWLIIASFTVSVRSLGAQWGVLNITCRQRYMLASFSTLSS